MKPLKIAVVVGKFPLISETFVINQLGFLKRSGHKIDILCLGEKRANFINNPVVNSYNLIENAIDFKWRDLMPLNKMKRLFKVGAILFKGFGTVTGFKLLESLNPFKYKTNALNCNQFFKVYYRHYFAVQDYDVVHVHFADNAVQVLPQLKIFKNKIIVTFHGYDAHNYDANFYKELVQLSNVCYTTNTEFIKRKVHELGFLNNKITVLPVGLNTTFFTPLKIEHERFNIVFIGRLITLKAPLLGIRIVESLINKGFNNCHFNIIGEGEEFSKCEQYIKENTLNDYVTLLGNKSQEEIRDVMNRSDVFLFPGIVDVNGRCEAQGLVVQEAQAMNLPVVISDVGGIKEGIIENVTGCVIKEKDIEAFADSLITFVKNPLKRKEFGQAGRAFVVNNYDSKILGEKLIKIYHS